MEPEQNARGGSISNPQPAPNTYLRNAMLSGAAQLGSNTEFEPSRTSQVTIQHHSSEEFFAQAARSPFAKQKIPSLPDHLLQTGNSRFQGRVGRKQSQKPSLLT